MKIHPTATEKNHADAQTHRSRRTQTDMTKLINAFRDFVNALNKILGYTIIDKHQLMHFFTFKTVLV